MTYNIIDIEGVGQAYADKLKAVDIHTVAELLQFCATSANIAEPAEAAGVDTVKGLRHRRADNLTAKLKETNAARKLTRRVPPCERSPIDPHESVACAPKYFFDRGNSDPIFWGAKIRINATCKI